MYRYNTIPSPFYLMLKEKKKACVTQYAAPY